MRAIKILIIFLLPFCAQAGPIGESSWGDLKTTAKWLFQGSYKQFSQRSSIPYLVTLVPTTWYTLKNDENLSRSIIKQGDSKFTTFVSDCSILLNVPILPTITYYVGKATKRTKLSKFAMEFTATMYLASAETIILSLIPIHERPNIDELDFFETEFRGDSSFPSGHVVPFAALMFKTYEYYGFWASIAPALLTGITAFQRVQMEKHYVSDVLVSILITGLASNGVRAAASSDTKLSRFQRWRKKHDFTVGLLRHRDGVGPLISLSY